jgi:hypothetical protein
MIDRLAYYMDIRASDEHSANVLATADARDMLTEEAKAEFRRRPRGTVEEVRAALKAIGDEAAMQEYDRKREERKTNYIQAVAEAAEHTTKTADRMVETPIGTYEYSGVWMAAMKEEAARDPTPEALIRASQCISSFEISKTDPAVAREIEESIERVTIAANKAIAEAQVRAREAASKEARAAQERSRAKSRPYTDGGRRMSYRSRKMKNHKKFKSYKKIRRGKRTKRRRY